MCALTPVFVPKRSSVMPKNASSKRVYACIFCGSAEKLSREHVWADWLREFLPRPGTRNFHWTSHFGRPPAPAKLHRAGDAHSQRLQVVCGRCNSGWMSQLQTDARPILAPLVMDNWTALSTDESLILARWATMTTMVIEYADPTTAMIPQRHRDLFMIDREPIPDWHIWIGRHDPGADHPAFFNHFGALLFSIDRATGLTTEYNFQTTTFTVGRVLFHTATITPEHPLFRVNHHSFGSGYHLLNLWPRTDVISSAPLVAHDKHGREKISIDAASTIGLPIFTAR
jgi:hypothetical protein